MRSHRLGALALVCSFAVLSAACSGDASPRAGNRTTGSPSTSSSSGTTSSASPGSGSTASPGAGTSGTPSAGSSGSPGSTGTSPTPSVSKSPFPKAPLQASTAKQCVTPGGTQTLSLQTAPKPKDGDNMIVVYDNQYSDGYDGSKYGGIDTNGRADANGKYSSTWVVALNAPVGQVRVDIGVAGKPGTNTKQIYWNVQKVC